MKTSHSAKYKFSASKIFLALLVVSGCSHERSMTRSRTQTQECHQSCQSSPEQAPVQAPVQPVTPMMGQVAYPPMVGPQYTVQQPITTTETCAAVGVSFIKLPIPVPKLYPVERQKTTVQTVVQQAPAYGPMAYPGMMPGYPMAMPGYPGAMPPQQDQSAALLAAALLAQQQQKATSAAPPAANNAATEQRINDLDKRLDTLINVLEKTD